GGGGQHALGEVDVHRHQVVAGVRVGVVAVDVVQGGVVLVLLDGAVGGRAVAPVDERGGAAVQVAGVLVGVIGDELVREVLALVGLEALAHGADHHRRRFGVGVHVDVGEGGGAQAAVVLDEDAHDVLAGVRVDVRRAGDAEGAAGAADGAGVAGG